MSCCGVSINIVRITDFDFADDAVMIAERTEVFVGAFESLSAKGEPLGLRVSWNKTKVQAYGDIMDRTIKSTLVSCENVKVTLTSICVGSVILSSTSCEQEVNRRLRGALCAMKFAGRRCVALPILVQTGEGPRLSLASLALFLRDLREWRLDMKTELLWYYFASPNPR